MQVLAEAKRLRVVSMARDVFSREEAKRLFDETARQYLSMSGDEFLCRWDNGTFKGSTDTRAMRVAILIPLVRKTSARQKSV